MSEDLTAYRWNWYWRSTDGEADCGIHAEVRTGHVYAVACCPRYMKRAEWEKMATHICDLHNAALAQAMTIIKPSDSR